MRLRKNNIKSLQTIFQAFFFFLFNEKFLIYSLKLHKIIHIFHLLSPTVKKYSHLIVLSLQLYQL